MLLTALPPAPPTPTTAIRGFMRAGLRARTARAKQPGSPGALPARPVPPTWRHAQPCPAPRLSWHGSHDTALMDGSHGATHPTTLAAGTAAAQARQADDLAGIDLGTRRRGPGQFATLAGDSLGFACASPG